MHPAFSVEGHSGELENGMPPQAPYIDSRGCKLCYYQLINYLALHESLRVSEVEIKYIAGEPCLESPQVIPFPEDSFQPTLPYNFISNLKNIS
jgi:hypothetical protein